MVSMTSIPSREVSVNGRTFIVYDDDGLVAVDVTPEKSRWKNFEVFVFFFLVFIVGMMAGYTWRMVHEVQPIKYEYVVPEKERMDFRKRLVYHGLTGGSVVFEDENGEYFIRNGKRCKF